MLLTLLEVVLSPEGDFPDGRADLFRRYLCKLIGREHKKQEDLSRRLSFEPEDLADMADARQPLLPDEAPLFTALSEIAYAGQKSEIKGERQEVSFDRRELKRRLKTEYVAELGENIWRAAWSLNLMIPEESRGMCRFRHQQFQEFFAARKLAQTRELTLAVAPHRPEDFRESLEDVRRAMKPWQQLPGVDRSGWEETVLMAAELAEDGDALVSDLAQVNLPLAGECAALETVSINIRSRLAERLLARMRDARADLRARIAAGHALGEMEALEVLGYEAITDGNGKHLAWLPPMEPIPEGHYTFGSKGDSEAYEEEHRFGRHLPAFRLGRYPVTHAEWRCFIEAGGYSEPYWWRGEAAEAFFEGRGTNEGLAQTWIFWRGEREAGRLEERLEESSEDPEIRDLIREKTGLDDKAWEDHLAEVRSQSERVTEPAFWGVSRYDNPLQPVVGISLFEALAYCHWLSELAGERYTLPHELQWEAAARGLGKRPRRYAFGEKLNPDVCNIREDRSWIGMSTPVGLYEQGKAPDTGLYDMTGNVWEWTTSAWRDEPPYDTDPLDGLDDGTQPRVVRGGAWDGILRLSRSRSSRRPLRPPGLSGVRGVPPDLPIYVLVSSGWLT